MHLRKIASRTYLGDSLDINITRHTLEEPGIYATGEQLKQIQAGEKTVSIIVIPGQLVISMKSANWYVSNPLIRNPDWRYMMSSLVFEDGKIYRLSAVHDVNDWGITIAIEPDVGECPDNTVPPGPTGSDMVDLISDYLRGYHANIDSLLTDGDLSVEARDAIAHEFEEWIDDSDDRQMRDSSDYCDFGDNDDNDDDIETIERRTFFRVKRTPHGITAGFESREVFYAITSRNDTCTIAILFCEATDHMLMLNLETGELVKSDIKFDQFNTEFFKLVQASYRSLYDDD